MEKWLIQFKRAYLKIRLTPEEKQKIWLNIINSIKNMEEEKENTIKRVVDGKEYTIHAPSDPAEDNMCDGCQ